MKFSIFIDYASLYISVSKIHKLRSLKDKEVIEDIVCSITSKIEKYVKQYYKHKEVEIVDKKAYILPDRQFQVSDSKLNSFGINAVRVDTVYTKASDIKLLNGSRDDDYCLNVDVTMSFQAGTIDGAIIISNDIDFSNIASMSKHAGKYIWLAFYEGKNVYVKNKLKTIADVSLPIQDLLSLDDDTVDVDRPKTVETILKGRRVEFYKNGEYVYGQMLIKKKNSLGRRSVRRNIIPNIDLTDFDDDKILSRSHGDLYLVGNKLIFCVNNSCTRGTWYEKEFRGPNEQFVVKEDTPVILGEKNGFVMYYYAE